MGQLYTQGMNSPYFARVDMLNKNVYDHEIYTIPYMPEQEFLFVAYFPDHYTTPTPTALYVYINNVFAYSVNVVDILGTIYFSQKYPYGTTNIIITTAGGVELRRYNFTAINAYLYYELASLNEQERLVELYKIQKDPIFTSVRDENIYNNFGYLFSAPKPADFLYSEYRGMIDSFLPAFLHGSTEYAIVEVVLDITGATPTITRYGEIPSWTPRRYYGFSKPSTTERTYNSIVETVQRDASGNYDYVKLGYGGVVVTSTISVTFNPVVYNASITYNYGVDYSVIPTLAATLGYSIGELHWLGSTKPTNNTFYTVEYNVDTTTFATLTNQEHFYAHTIKDDISETRTRNGLKLYARGEKLYQIGLTVNSSLRTITAESVTKAEASGGIDQLVHIDLMDIRVDNEELVKGTDDVLNHTPIVPYYEYPIVIKWFGSLPTLTLTAGVNIALEGVNFTVSHTTGTVYWMGLTLPPASTKYYATYKYGDLAVYDATLTYNDGVDFTVDRKAGSLTWMPLVTQPAKSATYTVSYKYHLKASVESAVEQVKPAHVKVLYNYV